MLYQTITATLQARLAGLRELETGQGMAEYGLILALVAVVVIGALTAIGGGIGSTLNSVTASL